MGDRVWHSQEGLFSMTDVMILAAGLGTRMKSSLAKVLHRLGGQPLIAYSARTALALHPENLIVIVGHQAEQVEQAVRDAAGAPGGDHLAGVRLAFVNQREQKGTGHAVQSAREILSQTKGPLVIITGDTPLLKTETLAGLVKSHIQHGNAATFLTVDMDNPTGYGRIVRGHGGRFVRTVEEKDATAIQREIHEVNVSVYCFDTQALLDAIDHITADNAQAEYYLTDVPAIMMSQGRHVSALQHADTEEVMGVNNRLELAELERKVRQKKLRELMLSGVTVLDPATTYIDQDVTVGQDTIIHPQVIIEGRSSIGTGCEIQSWTRLKDVTAAPGVTIKNHCVIEDSSIGEASSIGPFARIRMQADISEKVVIGNFVEVKKSKIGRGTKAQHLSYLGDATIGADVNIGAGTVTCNFDGERKHETIIEDNVKIGSDTMLVAPVRVGRGSKTGAGSVVTKDVPPDSLAVGVPAVIKKTLKQSNPD
jgi:bifunctional UDP-N-acetylglucosamine pyrophosphorylase/glucosamine-1-phosphate N-acetyltransferase